MAKEVPSGTSFHLHKNVGLNVGLFMIFDCNTYYVVVLLIIMMVEIYGVNFAIIDVVKEMELNVAAMKKQKAKYEEALQCPAAYEVALNSVSMRNAPVKSGVPFVDLPGNDVV